MDDKNLRIMENMIDQVSILLKCKPSVRKPGKSNRTTLNVNDVYQVLKSLDTMKQVLQDEKQKLVDRNCQKSATVPIHSNTTNGTTVIPKNSILTVTSDLDNQIFISGVSDNLTKTFDQKYADF